MTQSSNREPLEGRIQRVYGLLEPRPSAARWRDPVATADRHRRRVSLSVAVAALGVGLTTLTAMAMVGLALHRTPPPIASPHAGPLTTGTARPHPYATSAVPPGGNAGGSTAAPSPTTASAVPSTPPRTTAGVPLAGPTATPTPVCPQTCSIPGGSALAATVVWGQNGSFTTKVNNIGGSPSTSNLNAPPGVAVDAARGVYIADYFNNRVLYYPAGSQTATRVYGQPNFTSAVANYPDGKPSATSLYQPNSVAVDSGGGLYVTDNGNNRVLYYASGQVTPSRVYGQNGSFTTGSENLNGISANSLSNPKQVVLDAAGGLYVADYFNERVLFFPPGQTTATREYGQSPGCFSCATGNYDGISADSLGNPTGVALDGGGGLYVSDSYNDRVLYFPPGQTIATRVYGQPNFTSNASGGPSATTLQYPQNLAVDSAGGLYVADSKNNRVVYFPVGRTVAVRAYGQPTLSSNTLYANGQSATATSLSGPNGVTLDAHGNLYIADPGNHRVLAYLA